MGNGRIADVLVENKDNGLNVWADDGNKEIIKSVEGVFQVTQIYSRYDVTLDHRYDAEYVKKEIEAQIKINGVNKND